MMMVLTKRMKMIGKLEYRMSGEKIDDNEDPTLKKFQTNRKKNGAVLASIIRHVQSQPFRKNFQLKKYIHKHAWCSLHMWLVDYRLRWLNCSWSELPQALIYRWLLRYRMGEYNYFEMGSYSDRKERNIYFELRRIQNVVYWSMDDLYVYGFTEKSLKQIIAEDMGFYLEDKPISVEDEQNIEKIEQYIANKMKELKKTSIRDLINQQGIKWQL